MRACRAYHSPLHPLQICRNPLAGFWFGSSFPFSSINAHRLGPGPHLRTWNSTQPAVAVAVVPFFLLHLWPPAHARISRDHLLLRCVSGLLHLFIPDHPEQVKWCALITRVSRNYLHCLGFLRGYLDQERAQASPRFGLTAKVSYHSYNPPSL